MKTIKGNNRIIAEFMGYETYEQTDNVAIRLMGGNEFNSADRGHVHAKFHTSYEWLMPVVGKCLEICHEEMLNEWENSFVDAFLSTSFDLMFKEVTQFIEWYNKNKEL